MEPQDRRATSVTAPRQPVRRFTALVIDDHPLIREALAQRLVGLGAVAIAEAGSCAEARRHLGATAPDLALVGLTLPDGSGLDLLTDLRRAGVRRVVVVSGTDDGWAARRALEAGVDGYLRRSASPALITDGVGAVRDGRPFTDPGVTALLDGVAPRSEGGDGVAGLSAREVEVLHLVSQGMTNQQVGDNLGLSPLTVKSHLARIKSKLGTGDRAEMVAVAMRAGVIH
jgi:DNA-binding NarL/FixJ family response regulator